MTKKYNLAKILGHMVRISLLFLRRPGVRIFGDIIKTITCLLKKSLKNQEKLKELEIMYQNAIYICIS